MVLTKLFTMNMVLTYVAVYNEKDCNKVVYNEEQ